MGKSRKRKFKKSVDKVTVTCYTIFSNDVTVTKIKTRRHFKMTRLVYKNCKNKNDRDLAEFIINYIKDWEEKGIELYTSLLYRVLYPEDTQNLSRYSEYCDDIVTYYDLDNMLLINELLHYIHTQFPIARQEAMKNVSNIREFYHKEGTCLTVTFWDYQVFVGDFPKELKNRIEKIFENISDDLYITYTTTWMYSHLSEGIDYTYKENEHPQIDICFPNIQIREKIISIINTEFSNIEIRRGLTKK
jgi:hypothetical protein